MAFFPATTRDGNPVGNPFALSGTGANLGPGVYQAPTAFERKAPSHAPFAASSTRDGAVADAAFFPGPGRYNPPPMVAAPPKPSFESPFLSFADRFGHKAGPDVPGPGAYSTPTALGAAAAKRRAAAGVGAGPAVGAFGGGRGGPGSPGAGHEPNVTWLRVPTAPSIPARDQSYGYEEGKKGQLVRATPVVTGHSGKGVDTVGPGSYDVTTATSAVRPQAPIAGFGLMRSQRTDFSRHGGEVPDAGLYQPDNTAPAGSPRDGGDPLVRPTATFASRTGRKAGVPVAGGDTPGPGAYATVRATTSFKTKEVPKRNQFFSSTSRRFQGPSRLNSTGPGPGAYSVAAKPTSAPSFGDRGAGFASTASRFQHKLGDNAKGPSPGDYTLPSMAADLMKRREGSRTAGVFGCTTKRFFKGIVSTDGDVVPGPGEYLHADGPSLRPQYDKPSSVFQSAKERFPPKSEASAPPPGQYETGGQFGQHPVYGRRPDGTLGMISSGGPRFRAAGASEAPGPGSYDFKVDHPPATGAAMPQAPRFSVAAAPRAPGPGQYEAGPSLIKRSFNMVIVEEEERGMRR